MMVIRWATDCKPHGRREWRPSDYPFFSPSKAERGVSTTPRPFASCAVRRVNVRSREPRPLYAAQEPASSMTRRPWSSEQTEDAASARIGEGFDCSGSHSASVTTGPKGGCLPTVPT
jgi:hypothetical protein